MSNVCLRDPCTGGRDVTAANNTPRSSRTRSRTDRQNASASGNERPPSDWVSSRFSTSMPAFDPCTRRTLRIMRPQPTSSTTERASSDTMSSLLARRRRTPPARRQARGAQPVVQIDLRGLECGEQTENHASHK